MNPINIGGDIRITVDVSDRLCRVLDLLTVNLGATIDPVQHHAPHPATPPVHPVQYEQPSSQQAQPPAALAQPPSPQSTVPTTVPTSAPAYQLDDISNAAARLVDQNPANMQVLQELNKRFGVPSLVELPAVQYGAYANELRALGAKL